MKNKKGFTLIELIAVIIIIGLVALIAIPFFTRSFEDFKKNFYTNLSTTFLNGGKEFFADNSKYLPRRYLYAQKVSLNTLLDEHFLKSFKDYKGGSCDVDNSYVIVVKLSNKKYAYAPCLKCPGDNYEDVSSKYCNPEWGDNTNIDYVLGEIETKYVYRGTSRDEIKERTKVTLDVVKYNDAGEEVARVSGVGEDGIGTVYPSNLDTVDSDKVGEYPLEYNYQGVTSTGLLIVYENGAPIVVANRKQNVKDITKPIETNSTVQDTSEYDNSTNPATPDDVWAQKLVYTMSSASVTEPGVTIAEYQCYINDRWETFCRAGADGTCTKTIAEEMNESTVFRTIDTNGHIGETSREYIMRIDKTKPSCTLSYPDPDGLLDGTSKWYIKNFDITFDTMSDTDNTVNGKNVKSGLNEDHLAVLVNGTRLDAEGILGSTSGRQKQDNEAFVWYGYVEDKAGNWNVCETPTLKKDKTPPTCEVNATPKTNRTSSTEGVSGTYKCLDATSKCKVTATQSFSNLTSDAENTIYDKAGNSYVCKIDVCIQKQEKTDTCTLAKSCSGAGCKTYYSCTDPSCGGKRCTKDCCGTTSTYSGTCYCVYGGATMATARCDSYVYNHGGCGGYCRALTSYYSGSGSCNKNTKPKTCTKGSCCGWKSCPNSNCNCKTYKRSVSACGCATWARGNWTNSDSCSASHCNDDSVHANQQVCCRNTYYSCGTREIYLEYDSEGGSACSAIQGTLNGTWGTLCSPTKTGSTFLGWYTRPKGQGTKITSSSTVSGSLIVYAYWDSSYTLTYDNKGGSGCTTTTGTYGETWGDLCIPTKSGSQFSAWNTESDGSGSTITDESVVESNLTVYAQYDSAMLYVTYHTNDGEYIGTNDGLTENEGIITTGSNDYCTAYTYGSTGINLADYNNTNYINIRRAGYSIPSGEEWITEDGTTYSQSTNYAYSDFCSDPEGCDIMLYANWQIDNYSITYNLNGGTVSTANPTSYNIETETFTLNNPTLEDNTFTGWTGTGLTSASTSVSVNFGSTGNREYTANWRVNAVTCDRRYYMNGEGSCLTCRPGKYCEGITAVPNGSEQGLTNCPSGYTSDSGAGYNTECYRYLETTNTCTATSTETGNYWIFWYALGKYAFSSCSNGGYGCSGYCSGCTSSNVPRLEEDDANLAEKAEMCLSGNVFNTDPYYSQSAHSGAHAPWWCRYTNCVTYDPDVMDYYYWHTYNCKLEDGNCAAKEKTHVNSVDELKNQNQKCMDRAETTTTYSYTPSETYSTTCSNNNESMTCNATNSGQVKTTCTKLNYSP